MYEKLPTFPSVSDPLEGETTKIPAQEIGEYFLRLLSKQIGTLVMDGFDLVHLRSIETSKDSGLTRAVCDTAEGEQHEFIYDPNSSDQTVIHQIVEIPPEERS